MQPSDALGVGAQVAVTLAGFTGIVVVFGRRALHEWSAGDRFRLGILLILSILPFVMCLTGIFLLTTGMALPDTWRWCSAIAAVLLLGGNGIIVRTFARLERGEFVRVGGNRALFAVLVAVGLAIAALQLYNALALAQFWAFFAAVVTTMLICALQFVRLVLFLPGYT